MSFLQWTGGHDVTVSPISIQFFIQNGTLGSFMICAVKLNATLAAAGTFSMSDDNGAWDSSNFIAIDNDDGTCMVIGYKQNNQLSAVKPTVNVAWSGATGAKAWDMLTGEYGTNLTAGVIDVSSSALFTSTASPSTPAIATTNSIDTLIAFYSTDSASQTVSSPNGAGSLPASGWVNEQNVNGTNLILCDVDVTTANAAYKEVLTLSGADAGSAAIIAIKTTNSPATTPAPLMGQAWL